ncbi:hypothetical protein [Natronorarus salvus]|uniref:hypothetical protein n=1 Tax=Natronorarus salvus TaxID=3117733 RepID=UPI002F26BD7E
MFNSSRSTLVKRVVRFIDYRTTGQQVPDVISIHTIKQILVGYCGFDSAEIEAGVEQAVDEGLIVYDGSRGGYRLAEYEGEGSEDVA